MREDCIARTNAVAKLAEAEPLVALIDAGAAFGLPERIEAEGCEALSLFKGDAAEDARDHAPYLIRLELHGSLMRDFLDDQNVPWALWPRRAGILMCTNLSLQALQKHFRSFLRVSLNNRSFFFRFWEPHMFEAYISGLSAADEMRARWFYPIGGGRIDSFFVPSVEGDCLQTISPSCEAPQPEDRTIAFHLRPAEHHALLLACQRRDVDVLVDLMAKTFPDVCEGKDPADLRRQITRSVSRFAELGIVQMDHVFRLAAMDLHSAGTFELEDKSGVLQSLLRSDLPEGDKMRRLGEVL